MAIFEEINNGIKEAIRSRNQVRLDTLRMLKSRILAVDARGALSDEEVLKIFKTYFGNLEEALDFALTANRLEIADRLKSEIAIVQEFLPRTPSLEETRRVVEEAIAQIGAKTKKELGFVMKAIMKIDNRVNGKLAKELANELLADL
jgi:uncharacterized protein YqeY